MPIKVSVVKCVSYEKKLVKKALLDSLGNINFKFKPHMSVLIKPNLLCPERPEKGVTTHPIILEELCKILKKYNAKIYIGDSSSYKTDLALLKCGIDELSKYVKVVNFDTEKSKLVQIGEYRKLIPIPQIIFNVDLIINVAKMKTHSLTNATLCVKNLYGCVPGNLKSKFHKIYPSAEKFSRLLLNIHKLTKPGLNLIDGIIGLEGNGPSAAGTPIKSKVILASRDAIAIDVIGAEVMGFKSEQIPTNRLSKIKKEDIKIIGNGKNIRLNFKNPSSLIRSFLPFINKGYKFLPKDKIVFDYKKCKRCHICEEKCPAKAIKIKLKPICNHKKCIRCMCCIEVCPHGAVYLKEHWIKKFLRLMYGKMSRILLS